MGDDLKPGDLARSVARLQQLGATPAEIRQYVGEHRSAMAAAPEATPEQFMDDSDQPEPGLGTKALGTAASLLTDIPGMEAAQAGARALVRGQSYRDALSDIKGAEDAVPTPVRMTARLAGGTLGAVAAPGSTALRQGAAYGLAHGLAKSDPDAGVGNRVLSGAAEGAVGGVVGKLAEMASPVLRSFGAKDVDANIVRRTVARDKMAEPLYDQFRQLGDLGTSRRLADILDLPVVRTAVETVKKESPVLAKLPDTDARVLDAVYQRVGSKAFKAQHGFQTGEARRELLGAIEDAAQTKGGSYQSAVRPFAKASAKIDAVRRGALATRNASNTYGTVPSKAMTDSPEALAEWAKTATPAQRKAAEEGVLGRLSREPWLASMRGGITSGVPLPFPSRAVRNAPGLLRSLKRPVETPLMEMLRALATNGAVANPLVAQMEAPRGEEQ